MPTRYRLTPGPPLRWYEHPGEPDAILFHEASGDTHLVNQLTLVILQSLSAHECDVDQLITELRNSHGLVTSEELTPRIAQLLCDLVELGIVETINH